MLIFLYGEDAFRSQQKLLEIREKFLSKDPVGSGLSVFDFGENSNNKMLDALNTPNLLAPKRLVVAKELIFSGSSKEQEDMLNYFSENAKNLADDNDLVVIFWERQNPKKNNALYKFLINPPAGGVKSQEFSKLTGAKLNQWILKRIKELDAKAAISQKALDKLILYAGNETHVLNNELQKLVNFSSGKMISEEDVELLVKANLDGNIFATIDALSSSDKKEAARLLHRHLKKGEDPFYIFSMLVYQFRNLLKVADLKENFGASVPEITRISKLHPFVVRKSLAQLRNFSFSRLKKIYQNLADLDLKIKTGKIDIKLALDKIWAEL